MPVIPNITLLKWYQILSNFQLFAAITVIFFFQITHSYALAMAIFGVQSITAVLLEVPTGILSDFFSRKTILIAGAVCSLISLAFYSSAYSLWALIIGSIFAGIASALQSGNNEALLYDSMAEIHSEKEFTAVVGRLGAAAQTALSIAVLFGMLAVQFSLRLAFTLSLLPQLASIAVAILLHEPSHHKKNEDSKFIRHLTASLVVIKSNSRLRLLSIAQIIDNAVWTAKYQIFPAFLAVLWPVAAIGFVRALAHAASAFGNRTSGALIKKFGQENTLLAAEIGAFGIGTMVIALPSIATPIINIFAIACVGLYGAVRTGLIHQEFTSEHRATLGSVNSFFSALLAALLGYLFGLLADNLGIINSLLILQTLFLPVIFLYWRLVKHRQGAVVL